MGEEERWGGSVLELSMGGRGGHKVDIEWMTTTLTLIKKWPWSHCEGLANALHVESESIP